MGAPRSLANWMERQWGHHRLLILITALLLQDSQGDLMAQIHTVGTTGTISISTDAGILRSNLSGTCGSIRIFIHEFPVMYGASLDPCDEQLIGRPIYNVTMNAVGEVVIDGATGYDGRALVLETCGQKTCVNLQEGTQGTWRATLRSFIIGPAYFMQSVAQEMVVAVVDLALLEGTPTSNASLLFSGTCRIEDGHLVGSVELGNSCRIVRSRLALRNVTVMPFLLVKYEERWACAEVKTITPKEAVAQIGMLGVSGTFTFRQESPFHPTHITVNLFNLHGHAAHYGVHSLPVLPRQWPGQDICTGANTGELWDPLNVRHESTAGWTGHSSWPLGDLSGRHGTIQGGKTFLVELMDWNLPLFGNNSIVWRSVVIYNTSGEPWVCGTIRPAGATIRAHTVFRRGVMGRVMFLQASGDPYGEVSIYVELTHGTQNISLGHNWHIHNFPLLTESESCAGAGGHFNPYNVPVNKNYSEGCQSVRPLWCEAGDYASKHRPLSFLMAGPARHLFIDESTTLNGPNSIIGHSMVIHGAGGASTRVACANILLQHSSEARTAAWFGAGGAHGELWASQASDLDPTLVHFSFYGLRGLGGGFHIHLLPVGGASEDPCSNSRIKGHFNPFRVEASTSPAAGNGTDDEYEVGDISGRRGSLHDKEHVTKQYTDTNLPLSGTHSILGRSLVIHYDNGSRMQCASVLQELSSGGEWVHATAEFSGNISGRISL
ncbi:uncharacterized protein LOC130285418, partial [Hyla sarda]|uniref:uncharacterized protein LOC130285418 n=1 Tax=Hyla sarda TaxID=327740 RepID=UPI0024C404D3